MSARPEWRVYRAFTLATGGLLLATIGWLAVCYYGADRGHEACPLGTIQRLFMGIQYAWIGVVAARLWHLASVQDAARAL